MVVLLAFAASDILSPGNGTDCRGTPTQKFKFSPASFDEKFSVLRTSSRDRTRFSENKRKLGSDFHGRDFNHLQIELPCCAKKIHASAICRLHKGSISKLKLYPAARKWTTGTLTSSESLNCATKTSAGAPDAHLRRPHPAGHHDNGTRSHRCTLVPMV